MRFKQIAIGLTLAITGVAAAAFSLPSYPVILPGHIEVVRGQTAQLPIVLWNLRSKPITVTYIGDCCSRPQEISLPAFSSKQVKIGLDSANFPNRTVKKIATLQYKTGDRSYIEGFPYTIKVLDK